MRGGRNGGGEVALARPLTGGRGAAKRGKEWSEVASGLRLFSSDGEGLGLTEKVEMGSFVGNDSGRAERSRRAGAPEIGRESQLSWLGKS